MSTLIDALKGLQSEMEADLDESFAQTHVWHRELSKIIAEHERTQLTLTEEIDAQLYRLRHDECEKLESCEPCKGVRAESIRLLEQLKPSGGA